MKPVYFPFTYIPEPVARQLEQLFGPTIVYRPIPADFPEAMRRLQADGCIDLRIPYPEEGDRLVQSCREFKTWGGQHYGDGASLKKAFSEGFYNQSFTAQIRSDILKHDKAVDVSPDPVFAARLFLLMAQELDTQQYDLDRELALSMAAERELFARMNGQESIPDSPGEHQKNTDYGSVMTAARLSAWSHLFYKDAPESCFLVTNSRASVDQMMESFPNIRQVARFEDIPCDLSQSQRNELAQFLASLRHSPDAGDEIIASPELKGAETAARIHLTLYLLPHAGPTEIFSVLSHAGDAGQIAARAQLNTIIALCEG
ncbi:MAG: hypothetical protein WA081_16080 [Desulfosalsimonadaceae bacterium]